MWILLKSESPIDISGIPMTPEVVATLILTAGGLILALAAVVIVRASTRWPELVARVASLEATTEALGRASSEALDAANKARRIASRRESRRGAADDATDQGADHVHVGGAPQWVPGATIAGRSAQNSTGGEAYPMEIVA